MTQRGSVARGRNRVACREGAAGECREDVTGERREDVTGGCREDVTGSRPLGLSLVGEVLTVPRPMGPPRDSTHAAAGLGRSDSGRQVPGQGDSGIGGEVADVVHLVGPGVE